MSSVDNENNAPRLLGACWSLVGLSAIFLGLRIYCKRIRSTGLWWDDYLMIVAWVSLLISVCLNTYITSLGFGRHFWTVSDENLITIKLYTILVAVFGSLATTVSKTSFAVTLYRIITNRWVKAFIIFIIITVNIFLNLVWIFGFAKCTPIEKVFDSDVPGTCWNKQKLTNYQVFASYYSAIADFVLAFLPWRILMGMTMLMREKIGVAVAMSMGAVAGVTGIVKSYYGSTMTSPDITYDRTDLTIWTLAEPATIIMAASIPVLRMLYRELKSSQRYYFSNRTGGQTRPENSRHDRQSRVNHPSAVVGSRLEWTESQEQLRDIEIGRGDHKYTGRDFEGIIKTQEVRMQSSPNHGGDASPAGNSSIELGPVERVMTKQ